MNEEKQRPKGEAMSACGLFLLYKEAGMTSQSAVSRVKRLFGADKAGHTGTLDPMAEGVLPILLGRAVKASEFLLSGEKHYIATLRLGITTDTEDTTGKTLSVTDTLPTEEAVMAVLPRFRGKIMQTPPMYSALKVNGKKLCDLARQGKEIEREPREITVYSLTAEKKSESDYALTVHCSKGTYIRTLCADIGKALGVGGAMASLLRSEAAGYPLSRAVRLSDLEGMTEKERLAALIPLSEIFASFPRVTLPDFYARLAHAGAPIYQKKLKTDFALGERVAFYDKNGFFALAEAALDREDEPVLRSLRLFAIDETP
jgi:tRNA pseudouridine55 synthase